MKSVKGRLYRWMVSLNSANEDGYDQPAIYSTLRSTKEPSAGFGSSSFLCALKLYGSDGIPIHIRGTSSSRTERYLKPKWNRTPRWCFSVWVYVNSLNNCRDKGLSVGRIGGLPGEAK